MTVSLASFRADFPLEFGNAANYPDSAITYWLAMASILLQTGAGAPPQVCSFTGQMVDSNELSVSAIDFGALNKLPLLLEGNGVPVTGVITNQLTGAPGGIGVYQCNFAATIGPEPMVALQINFQTNASSFWGPSSLVPSSPPTTLADFATEMWVAHQIVLEKQAVDQARTGGNPGTAIGVITNKSVNGVSVGYDVSAITGGAGDRAGYYNQTIYGIRFWRLARIRGMGPIQIGIGCAPPFLIFNSFGFLGGSNAWGGPFPGIAPGDTGFGG